MAIKLKVLNHITETLYHQTGEVVFVDGEVKGEDFDTLSEPINLSAFNHGEIRLLTEDKVGSPSFQVKVVTIDPHTGEFYTQITSPAITTATKGKLLIGKESGSFLGSKMAIMATLSGGEDESFKVTITGEFKR